jgi:hypothetical protein
MAGMKIDCPHCHFATLLPAAAPAAPAVAPRRSPLPQVLAIVIVLGAAGYGLWHSRAQPPPPAPLPPQPVLRPTVTASNAATALVVNQWHGMEAGSVTLEKATQGNLVYAVGKVHNTTAQQKFGVKVQVDLFDGQGVKIGSANDYAASLDAGKDWHFRALVVDHGAVKARIADITED